MTSRSVLYHSLRTGSEKTLKNPMTYIGAALVGTISFITRDYGWGLLVPFAAPLLVQGLARILTEYEYQDKLLTDITPAISETPDIVPISDLPSYVGLLASLYKKNHDCILVKIHINHAGEVARLNESDGLAAEIRMTRMLETILQRNFEDGVIVRTAFNKYLAALSGSYRDLKARLQKFIDEQSSLRIDANGNLYYPKLICGITPLNDDFGGTVSRLELAVRIATRTSGRLYWFLDQDSGTFKTFREKRTGLRLVRQGMDNQELGLFAQPIVGLNGSPAGQKYEILLRHYRNKGDISSPVKILQYAEFNKISQDLDLYVIELLCRNFHRLYPASRGSASCLSINLSSASFTNLRFPGQMAEIIEKHAVPKDRIILEVTENIANRDSKQAVHTMEILRTAGYKIALDDIGIGSSNFRNLNRFPVDYFKIDRSYCEEIRQSAETRRFVQLVIDIGKSAGREIIAEGVPDQETLHLLTQMGVDYSQSFITGKPEESIPAPRFGRSSTKEE